MALVMSSGTQGQFHFEIDPDYASYGDEYDPLALIEWNQIQTLRLRYLCLLDLVNQHRTLLESHFQSVMETLSSTHQASFFT